jgi:hypothetical protein
MSISHFHPVTYRLATKEAGKSPCGKWLYLCNWTTSRATVNCKKCLEAMRG